MNDEETHELEWHFKQREEQRRGNVKPRCPFGELKVFWHGWSTGACK